MPSTTIRCSAGTSRPQTGIRVRRTTVGVMRSRSIAPERLIRARLIQILFSVRSERKLIQRMQYILLFRWFIGLGIKVPVWGEERPEICPVDRFQP